MLIGDWHAFQSGRYSGNYWDLEPGKRSFNFKTNWNGGVSKDKTGSFYFMTAGGEGTKPSVANPSRHKIERKDTKPKYEAIELKSAKLSLAEQDKLILTWETDSQTLPQFGYKITGHDNPSGQGEPLFQLEVVEPHTRRAELLVQEALGQAQVFVRIRCSDILGNESQILSLNLDD